MLELYIFFCGFNCSKSYLTISQSTCAEIFGRFVKVFYLTANNPETGSSVDISSDSIRKTNGIRKRIAAKTIYCISTASDTIYCGVGKRKIADNSYYARLYLYTLIHWRFHKNLLNQQGRRVPAGATAVDSRSGVNPSSSARVKRAQRGYC